MCEIVWNILNVLHQAKEIYVKQEIGGRIW